MCLLRETATIMAVVLLVDDDADILDLLELIVEEAGHRVLRACNGAVALVLARQHRPDLLISDLMMPVLDGYGLVAAIRADPALATLPIVVMTAGGVAPERAAALAPAQQIIQKPFSIEYIENLLNELVEGN